MSELQWTKKLPTTDDVGKVFVMRYKLEDIFFYTTAAVSLRYGVVCIQGWSLSVLELINPEFLGPLPE